MLGSEMDTHSGVNTFSVSSTKGIAEIRVIDGI